MQNRWPSFIFYSKTVNSCTNFMKCNWSKAPLRNKIANLVKCALQSPFDTKSAYHYNMQ